MNVTTALVWVLMSVNPLGNAAVTYSPPAATMEDCKRMQEFTIRNRVPSQCVQITMVVSK